MKYVTCGRFNCACRLGERHGPYYYIRVRNRNNRYVDKYVSTKNIPSYVDQCEVIGNDIILDVESLEAIPQDLKRYPLFVVQERIQ